jgi:NADH:ubiquinone oxidoreductase subunit K
MNPVPLQLWLIVSANLFALGLFAVMTRRHAVAVLIGIELMLNAANINLVAFSHYLSPNGIINTALDGQIFALMIIALAACEVAVGLAIILRLYRMRGILNPDDASRLMLDVSDDEADAKIRGVRLQPCLRVGAAGLRKTVPEARTVCVPRCEVRSVGTNLADRGVAHPKTLAEGSLAELQLYFRLSHDPGYLDKESRPSEKSLLVERMLAAQRPTEQRQETSAARGAG